MPIPPDKYSHGFLSAKLAAIRHIAVRFQSHFRKIGDNALLLTGLVSIFAVKYYKKTLTPGRSHGERESNGVVQQGISTPDYFRTMEIAGMFRKPTSLVGYRRKFNV